MTHKSCFLTRLVNVDNEVDVFSDFARKRFEQQWCRKSKSSLAQHIILAKGVGGYHFFYYYMYYSSGTTVINRVFIVIFCIT